jgi:hypothetical protein
MYIWSLERKGADYDEIEALVIIADTEPDAREVAAKAGYEGDVWYNPAVKVCAIGEASEEEAGKARALFPMEKGVVVLASYRS